MRRLRDEGVAWMNRGHALLLRTDAVGLSMALEAYNEAVVILRRLPVRENPSWANSLGAALMNRGHLLHRLHGVSQATVALEALAEAERLLQPLAGADNPWPRRNCAGTLVNRANLLLDLSLFAEGSAATRAALALVVDHEQAEVVDADLALKARRTLCDAIGRLIVAPGADQDALAREASDLVDEALALARYWLARGENAFQPLALRLFRYGTQLYRFHQPHFLSEFIRENLPETESEFHAIARETVSAALSDRPRTGSFLSIGDPVSERFLQTCRELNALRTFLAA